MSRRSLSFSTIILSVLLMAVPANAFGPGHNELGDAGPIPALAQGVVGGGSLQFINGSTGGLGGLVTDFQDMYLFQIDSPAVFSASTVVANGGAANFDTEIWIFDSTGRGILANDDFSAVDVRSRFDNTATDCPPSCPPATIVNPGFYYLAISGHNDNPLNLTGLPLFNQATLTEISGPDGAGGADPIRTWNGAGAVGQYTIALTGASFLPPPDPWETWVGGPGSGTFVNFNVNPIPADFFGPGSDPFTATVTLIGDPINPTTLGSTSTLVQRNINPFLPADPPGGPVPVQIEIIELRLVSQAPVTVTFNGGMTPEAWDLRVTLDPNVAPPVGQMTATKTHANGGVFDAVLPVQPRYTFTRVSDNAQAILDTADAGVPANQLDMQGVPWVHSAHPALPIFVQPGASFVPGVLEQIPGDPASQITSVVTASDPNGSATYVFCPPTPPIPIPTVGEWGLIVMTLVLLVSGGLVLRGRRGLGTTARGTS